MKNKYEIEERLQEYEDLKADEGKLLHVAFGWYCALKWVLKGKAEFEVIERLEEYEELKKEGVLEGIAFGWYHALLWVLDLENLVE